MAKVLGVGGVFFRSPKPARRRAWYAKRLGIFGWFLDPDKLELWQPPVPTSGG